MNIELNASPRQASAIDGAAADMGRIVLSPNEQVTFRLPSGAEYDVAPKDWGLYATPSLGARLPRFGLRGVLVRGASGLHLMLVEAGKEPEFAQDMAAAKLAVVCWLDEGVSGVAGAVAS